VNLKKYEGTRSQVILSQIDSKLREKAKKDVPRLAKDEKLLALLQQKKDFAKAADKADNDFDKRCNELGIVYSDYRDKDCFDVCNECLVPDSETKLLQRASDLQALGKKREAQAIWEGLIQKYKLGD
jgi:parvulin-like peptidyl-prolyl isomerase